MAVPTISSISPDSGQSAGQQVIVITGTGFKVPVVSYAVPLTALTATVSVTIGSRAARRVDVISATEIRVLTPRYRGVYRDAVTGAMLDVFPASDVVVTNLDANGVAIPGETVTLADGYTYLRWVLGAPRKDPPLLKVLRVLIEDLIRDVAVNTAISTHVDYGEEGTAVVVDLAELPSIGLKVEAPRDLEWAQEDYGRDEITLPSGDVVEYEGMRTHMLVCDLTLSGEGNREAMFLVQGIADFVQANPTLEVDADADLFPGEVDEFALEISRDAVQVSNPGNMNVTSYTMQIRVRGIQVLPDEPVVSQLGETVELILTETNMDGENPVETSV